MKSTVILKASLVYFTVFIFSLYRSLVFNIVSSTMIFCDELRKSVLFKTTTTNCYLMTYRGSIFVPTQVDKMRAELTNLNHCAVPFLSRAAVNLCWYYHTFVHLRLWCGLLWLSYILYTSHRLVKVWILNVYCIQNAFSLNFVNCKMRRFHPVSSSA